MNEIRPADVVKAEELLKEVRSWPEEEIDDLPLFYRQKAREYRQLPQHRE